jgi:quinoprotein glucose dehydrogenase
MRLLLGVSLVAVLGLQDVPVSEPIDRSNVQRLTVAWTYDTRESTAPVQARTKAPAFEATPAYADGRLYFATPKGLVIALEAETGAEAWRVDLNVRRDANYSDFASRGVTLSGDRIYAGTVDARLVCLRRSDGRFCDGFGKNGQIDLTEGLRRKPQYVGEYGVTSPPAVYRNLVIVGSSVADNSRVRMASGEVRAFDATTGALRWTFHPLPAAAPAGGANTWSQIVVDAANGLVFLPTGSASPDYFGGLREGNNGHANSIVALRAETGEVAWSFQTVHHDLWDYDVASPPLLYPGGDGPAVAVGSKTGHVFLFNRVSGRPIFPIEERRVAASDVEGESAAATQPFPTRPPAVVPQAVRESDLWAPDQEQLEACRALFRSFRNEGIFTPPSFRGSIHVPGNIGGLQWGGLAYDAGRRLLITPVNNVPAIIRLIPRADFDKMKSAYPDRETTEQDGTPFSMSRQFFLSPKGVPCVAPPWGQLVAISVDTGDIAWRVTLGDLRQQFGLPAGPPTGAPSLGGLVVSDTGVAFVGATMDPYFRAFDTENGRLLWEARLPTSARATPVLFTTPRGRRMVAIAAGGHDTPLSRLDTKVVAFTLPARGSSQ